MSVFRSLAVLAVVLFASLCLVQGGKEANSETSAYLSHNRRLLEEDEEFDCFCFEIYDPVCGKDGKTYSNSCFAGCAGVKVACQGECPCKSAPAPSSCLCIQVYDPVCGVDGTTYSNSGCASCAGVEVACQGECPCKASPSLCPCPFIEVPVCGKDGKTYANPCLAACADVEVVCEGECPCKKLE